MVSAFSKVSSSQLRGWMTGQKKTHRDPTSDFSLLAHFDLDFGLYEPRRQTITREERDKARQLRNNVEAFGVESKD